MDVPGMATGIVSPEDLVWVHMDGIFFNAVGHTGVSTYLLLSPENSYAIILFMNGNPGNYFIQRGVLERMWQEGQRLTSGN